MVSGIPQIDDAALDAGIVQHELRLGLAKVLLTLVAKLDDANKFVVRLVG